jgi:hypothetical protein
MKNYHIIKVKYFGATNYTGSRVKMISERFNVSKTIPYNHELNSIQDIAADYLQATHNIIGIGEGKDCMYVISDTFEPIN